MQRFAGVLERLSRTNPWPAVGTFLGLGLLVYCATLGVWYWLEAGKVSALTEEIGRLSSVVRGPPPDVGPSSARLKALESRIKMLRGEFDNQSAEDLIAAMSATARESGVQLLSIRRGDPLPAVERGIRYQTQRFTVTLGGRMPDLQSFLYGLHLRLPTSELSDLRLTGLEDTVSAQAQIVFYTSAEPVAESPQASDALPPVP